MSATMVSVTVIDSDGTSDFAAPQGATGAGRFCVSSNV